MKNSFHLSIPEQEKIEIDQAMVTLKTKLLPHLVNLSKSEKQVLPKLGDKTVAFVNKALMHMEQNPDLVPQYINLEDLKVDMEAVKNLKELQATLNQISDTANDSLMFSGSEAYMAVLTFYHNLKGAAKSNVPGAELIYDDLKVRFPGGKKSKEDPTNQ